MSIAFRYAARSNVGKVRKNNQDSGYAGPNLLILADGMGGPAGGDLASVIAVDHLRQIDQADTTSWTIQQGQQVLAKQVSNAHTEMHYLSQQDPALSGFGTTCIGLIRCQNDTLAMSHIGDSRAYLLRGDEFKQVTKDHSFVQFLYETGQIKKEEMATHPNRSVLLRVLGDSVEHDTPDLLQELAFPGDRWLLCSDGLCGYVPIAVIYEIIKDTQIEPGIVADRLIEAALAVGAPDNVTVVVADMVEEDGTPLDTVPQVVGSAQVGSERLENLRNLVYAAQEEQTAQTELDLDVTQKSISYSPDRGSLDGENEESTQQIEMPLETSIVNTGADDQTQEIAITPDTASSAANNTMPVTTLTAYQSEVDEDFTQAVAIPNASNYQAQTAGSFDGAEAEDAVSSLSVPPAQPNDQPKSGGKNAWYRTKIFRAVTFLILIVLLGCACYYGYHYLNATGSTSSPSDTDKTEQSGGAQQSDQPSISKEKDPKTTDTSNSPSPTISETQPGSGETAPKTNGNGETPANK